MPERKPVFGSSPRARRELRRLRMPPASEGLHLGGTCGLELAEAELAKAKPRRKLQLIKGGGR